ncbi:hypothetical protein ACTA71_009487 [Dictyostelium dimigraforme]
MLKETDEDEESSGLLSGVDNTEELQRKLELKTKVIQNFFIDRIQSKFSFKPEGMRYLDNLKQEILEKLKALAITVEKQSTITRLLTDLTDGKIEVLINQLNSISL